MTDIKTTGVPAAKKTGFVRVTKRQARFLAMTDVIMSLYEQLMRDYPECTTPSAIISRTVNESDDYEWLRAQYPDWPKTREAVWRIIHRKNKLQQRVQG